MVEYPVKSTPWWKFEIPTRGSRGPYGDETRGCVEEPFGQRVMISPSWNDKAPDERGPDRA